MAETKINKTELNFDAIYPVGSIYISVVDTNPSTYFGGTWAAFGAGRTLVGVDSGDGDFDSVEETGGAKTHTLTIAEMPAHDHPATYGVNTASPGSRMTVMAGNGPFSSSNIIEDTGGGGAHNNLQPYITVYMWKRTA